MLSVAFPESETNQVYLSRSNWVNTYGKRIKLTATNELKQAQRNPVVEKDNIPYNGKVRLLQGMKDAALPWEIATLIANKLTSTDVKVVLMKESNHRLSSDSDVKEIYRMLDDFLD